MTTALFNAVIALPFGHLGIRADTDAVRELVYLPRSIAEQAPNNALSEQTAKQCEHYCEDADFRFDLPLAHLGTDFQQRVWHTITHIPRGEVLTYGAIAKHLHSGPRAVGQACGANWFPLVIPCHRVIAAGGLGGFAHQPDTPRSSTTPCDPFQLETKRWLLRHEGVVLT